MLFGGGFSYVYEEELLYDTFPDGFAWGVATAAYQVSAVEYLTAYYWYTFLDYILSSQIEGGWNEGGKGLSIWDTFTEQNGKIDDGSDGKIACDSYHKFEEDVQLIKDLGLTYYRFSIAWTRIIPNGIMKTGKEKSLVKLTFLINRNW